MARRPNRNGGQSTGPDKPKKPYRDYPLFPHANGQWAKKIRGKLHYFGVWEASDTALKLYLDQKDDLQAGRVPRVHSDVTTVRDLVNRFLTSKQQLLDSGEITKRTLLDYHATCKRINSVFGLNRAVDDLSPEDFRSLRKQIASTRGPVALGNEIQRVRVVFKYAYDALIVDAPVRFGPDFKRPSKKVLRTERNRRGTRMFEAHEIQKLSAAASLQLRAMILLGINCGFGNQDCGTLQESALDLDAGWVDFPRPKTGVSRRCPLCRRRLENVAPGGEWRSDEKRSAQMITCSSRIRLSENPKSSEPTCCGGQGCTPIWSSGLRFAVAF